jgi:outer membrane protein assembly factor BamB
MFTFLLLSTPLLLQQPGGGQFMPSWQKKVPYDGDRLISIKDLDADGADDWLHVDSYAERDFRWQGVVTAFSGRLGGELWSYAGPGAYANMGLEPSAVVDFEGDGRMELLFSLPSFDSPNWPGGGVFFVVDSVTGQVLWEKGGEVGQDKFSKNVLLTDFDSDGLHEIVLSSRGQSGSDKISCFSATGTLIWQSEVDFDGPSMQAVDFFGDGTAEILLQDPARIYGPIVGAGKLLLLQGDTGQLLWERWGALAFEKLGSDLLLRDLDQDGVIDILSLGPNATVNAAVEAGTAVRLSPADGSELWRLTGSVAKGRFGQNAQVGDADGNGIDDLYVGIPNYALDDGLVQAFECATGALLWNSPGTVGAQAGHGQNLWLENFHNTGGLQLLVEQRQGRGSGNKHSYFGWKLLDAATGLEIWQKPYRYIGWEDSVYQLHDFNGDGLTEIVVHNPAVTGPVGVGGKAAGLVLVLDSRGRILWAEQGTRDDQNYGFETLLSDLNADGVTDLIISAKQAVPPNSIDRGLLEARDGISGNLLWQLQGTTDKQRLADSIELVDLNRDGQAEILSKSTSSTGWRGPWQGELLVLHGDTGKVLWRMEGNKDRAFLPRDVVVGPDMDGDGWDEVGVLGNKKVTSLNGSGNFQGFMTASAYTLSASTGGTIDFPLDFTPEVGWQEYRVVFSAHGTGLNYEFGLPIPLTLDHWLRLSMAGGLPITHFRNAEGVLDINGRAAAQIRFGPGEIPSQMIGLSLTFATVARLPWQDWEYCSVPNSILIQL